MAKIKFRLKNGKLYEVKDASFVEICDDTNQLAGLVYMTNEGVVHMLTPEDQRFKRYVKSYKLKSSPMTYIDTTPIKDR